MISWIKCINHKSSFDPCSQIIKLLVQNIKLDVRKYEWFIIICKLEAYLLIVTENHLFKMQEQYEDDRTETAPHHYENSFSFSEQSQEESICGINTVLGNLNDE